MKKTAFAYLRKKKKKILTTIGGVRPISDRLFSSPPPLKGRTNERTNQQQIEMNTKIYTLTLTCPEVEAIDFALALAIAEQKAELLVEGNRRNVYALARLLQLETVKEKFMKGKNMKTIGDDTDPIDAVRHALSGGKFILRLHDPNAAETLRTADVLDEAGNRIGGAQDWTYKGKAFVVTTRPFAGHVPLSQIEFVS